MLTAVTLFCCPHSHFPRQARIHTYTHARLATESCYAHHARLKCGHTLCCCPPLTLFMDSVSRNSNADSTSPSCCRAATNSFVTHSNEETERNTTLTDAGRGAHCMATAVTTPVWQYTHAHTHTHTQSGHCCQYTCVADSRDAADCN